eukprot:CAMPEP_0168537882 /NCGR_PEP_ID=MMETSP0405-20121227/20692_1 /TAXON_ID=498012 /ORGANISM="Trichosphaerium sp, Strain Am-I-7 wt" /LENGTH=95 /DNA_ID=CAMNT_0008566729 /DNA_START=450 /DNA_END=734 /DNA_ORIENTATION=-
MIPDNTEFFITIEEQGTMPTTPSTSKVVSGVFSEQKTILSAKGSAPHMLSADSIVFCSENTPDTTFEVLGVVGIVPCSSIVIKNSVLSGIIVAPW